MKPLLGWWCDRHKTPLFYGDRITRAITAIVPDKSLLFYGDRIT